MAQEIERRVGIVELEHRLDKIEIRLDGIANTLNVLAVQEERINRVQAELSALRIKYDGLIEPNGTLTAISTFQASCPRAYIKWVWMVLIPQGFVLLGVAWKLFNQ